MRENYEEYKRLVNDCLIGYMPYVDSKSRMLADAMDYSLMAGGKRLRPVLLLASCEFAGGRSEEALPYACAIEYIHTYSLVHDDLPAMDDDELRRGKPTNHMVYGAGMATLAGDGLLNTAYEVMIKDLLLHLDDSTKLNRRINVMCTIAKAAGIRGMVAGQAADIENERTECSNEMLEYIHLNKTGALIEASVTAGLIIGGADEDMMRNMGQYAECLGLAFQIADDILDVRGSKDLLGKNTGSDATKQKTTYISVNGLEAAEAKLSELTAQAVKAIAPYYDNAEFFRDLVIRHEGRTH